MLRYAQHDKMGKNFRRGILGNKANQPMTWSISMEACRKNSGRLQKGMIETRQGMVCFTAWSPPSVPHRSPEGERRCVGRRSRDLLR
jgi:hypothetical protein